MYYGLVYFPAIDTRPINQIRRTYDPTVDLIAPHLTIMFPVPDEIGLIVLIQHIERVIKPRIVFPIQLKGLVKSWDHWLFLTLAAGNTEIIALNKALYTSILEPYHRPDLEFIPHISLGLFVKETGYDHKNPQQLTFDEPSYRAALRETEALNLDFTCTLDKLHLVALTDDFSNITTVREFPLGISGE
ncbi:2'-5' RNA ligase family protein [Chloroflexota bacterium]